MSSGIFAAEARSLRKTRRTRARLMDAAVAVFARRGIEAASVSEVAEAAEVANGTFYNHFKDKDEIVATVAFRIATDLARRVDEAMAEIEDATLRVSFATRRFIELAAEQPEWGTAFLRAVDYLPELRRQASIYARADIERGVRDGAFKVEVDDFLLDIFVGTVLTALMLRVRGEVGPEAGPKLAEYQLRLLGVPPAQARRVAWRKLPPLLDRETGQDHP